MTALIAVVALLVAGVGQVQSRTLRHRVVFAETDVRDLWDAVRKAPHLNHVQVDQDIDVLVRLVAERDQVPDLLDVAGADVVDAAEDLLRGEGGAS